MHPLLGPTTFFSFLILTNLAATGSLTLSDIHGGGCNLKFDDICGCSKTVIADPSRHCDEIRGRLYGVVCRGSWRLDASLPLDKRIRLSFDNRRDCRQRCVIIGGRNSCEGKDYENDATLKQLSDSPQNVPDMAGVMSAASEPAKVAPGRPCPAGMMRGPNNPEACVPKAGPPQSSHGTQIVPLGTHMMPAHIMPEHIMPDTMMPGASHPPPNIPITNPPNPINDMQNPPPQPSKYPGLVAQQGCKPQRVRKLACNPIDKQCSVDVLCCNAGCDPAATARNAFGEDADGTFVVEDLPVMRKGVDVFFG
ncbi:MAG: hypothetical protein Q9213_007562 [Squamulea squamosa]